MLQNRLHIVHEIIQGVRHPRDPKNIWHERVPVIEEVEFQVDTVIILEGHAKEYLWIVDESEVVAGKMLDVVFNHYLNCFTCKWRC